MEKLNKILVNETEYDLEDASAVHISDIVQTTGDSETAVMSQAASENELRKAVRTGDLGEYSDNRKLSAVAKNVIAQCLYEDWDDAPETDEDAGIFISYCYGNTFSLQTLYSFPSLRCYTRIVAYSTGAEITQWSTTGRIEKTLCTGDLGEYSNNRKLSAVAKNVIAQCLYEDWDDAPETDEDAGIFISYCYGNTFSLQTLYSFPSLRCYTRIVAYSDSTVVTDWTDINKGLHGSTVLYTLGDSITAGSYSTDEGTGVAVTNADWAYGKQIADKAGCQFVNLGVPGANIVSGILAQANSVGSDATIVTITGGANDYYGTGSEIGEITDTGTTTICGALKKMIETIAAKAPKARIVLISPLIIKSGSSTIETQWSRNYAPKNFTYDQLNEAFKAVANFCNVEFIDGTTQGTTNIYNIATVQKDGVHPTIEYYGTIANWLYSKLF